MSAPSPVVLGVLGVPPAEALACVTKRGVLRTLELTRVHKCEVAKGGIGFVESLRALALEGEERRSDVMLVSSVTFASADRVRSAWQEARTSSHAPQEPTPVGDLLVTLATLSVGHPHHTRGFAPPVERVLREVYALTVAGRIETAATRVWEAFDDVRVADDIDAGATILDTMDLHRVSPEVMVAALNASRGLRNLGSKTRARFWERVREALGPRTESDANLARYLQRLKD